MSATDTLWLLGTWAAVVIVGLIALIGVVVLAYIVSSLVKALFFRPVKKPPTPTLKFPWEER